MRKAWIVGAALALPFGTAVAQEAYVVGLSGAMTGPASATYAPVVEAIRLYLDGVNAKGGVNGKQVEKTDSDSGDTSTDTASQSVDRLLSNNVDAIVGAARSAAHWSILVSPRCASVARAWFRWRAARSARGPAACAAAGAGLVSSGHA